uniref:MARVEL domain-containing protein n=1 Tax=Globodera rostochiensis TaxID=31243 RepID=A0A914HEJ5_GLORO
MPKLKKKKQQSAGGGFSLARRKDFRQSGRPAPGGRKADKAHSAPPSRICCCDLKTAGLVVAFVEFLLCILTVYGLFRNLHLFGFSYLIWFILGIISIVIILIAIILLLYAIKKESARFLIPHISAQIFLIGWLIIVALVVALLLLFGAYNGIRRLVGQGDYYTSDYGTHWLGIMIIIVYLAIAGLELFFLYIVWQLYKYFRAYSKLSGTYESGIIVKRTGGDTGPVMMHSPANGDWYIPPKNQNTYGGSPEAGDIYPYEAPIV